MEQHANWRTASHRVADAVVGRIDGLATEEDEVKPTKFAYIRARSIVESAYGLIKGPRSVPEIVPEASVTTDDVGGIRLAWRNGPRHVLANFGAEADLRSYIYFESPHEHQIEALDAQHLAGRLAWLTSR